MQFYPTSLEHDVRGKSTGGFADFGLDPWIDRFVADESKTTGAPTQTTPATAPAPTTTGDSASTTAEEATDSLTGAPTVSSDPESEHSAKESHSPDWRPRPWKSSSKPGGHKGES